MIEKDDNLDEMFSKLCINAKEYNMVELLINNIKNDKSIKDDDKINIFIHIDNVYFHNLNKNKKNKIKKGNDMIKHKESCKKCEKNKFKKYDYCYKHCQEEELIPKDVKRKDFNDYIKEIDK